MISGLTTLLAFQLAGETLAFASGSAVPGPVIGLVLLAICLSVAKRWRPQGSHLHAQNCEAAADSLLANLGVLFVPAGVGVMQHGDLLAHYGASLFLVLLVSTAVTLIVTVGVFVIVDKTAR